MTEAQYHRLEADLAVELAAKRVEILQRAAAFEPIAAQLTQARMHGWHCRNSAASRALLRVPHDLAYTVDFYRTREHTPRGSVRALALLGALY